MANVLVLGRGKTGSAVVEAARERGHSVQVVGSADNENAQALTPALLAHIDVAIDFTTPQAVLPNLRALLTAGKKVVVGTTGWHEHLTEMTALARAHGASLLYGTNFSLGVQAFFRAARLLAEALPGYELEIEETHHITKKDAPSGTALTLQQVVGGTTPITSHRVGDASGLHVLTLRSPHETLTLEHESFSRKAFAEGAIQAAEWLGRQEAVGVRDFVEVAHLLQKRPKQVNRGSFERTSFLDYYRAAHNNAVDLLEDAEILFERSRYSRAYALAFTALEEIAKSQLAADVHTSYISKEEFQKCYTDHRQKIKKAGWATEEAKQCLSSPDGEYLEIETPSFPRRNESLYVSLNNNKITSPQDIINRDKAKGIIHTVNVALQQITEMTEYWGHQIGTKGFMR